MRKRKTSNLIILLLHTLLLLYVFEAKNFFSFLLTKNEQKASKRELEKLEKIMKKSDFFVRFVFITATHTHREYIAIERLKES